MDVRGCKKGKGGRVKKRKEGGRVTTSARSASGVEGQIEDEQREGQNMKKHNTTTTTTKTRTEHTRTHKNHKITPKTHT